MGANANGCRDPAPERFPTARLAGVKRWSAGLFIATAGCANASQSPTAMPVAHAVRGHPSSDPTVRGARLVPETIDVSSAFLEPSGSVRGVVHGVRFRMGSQGGIVTAQERIDDGTVAIPLPARLGGGFLFVLGDTVQRADDWLARPAPIVRAARGVTDIFVGLDRIYLRTKTGNHVAFDPIKGELPDLGPWPEDPVVGPFVAFDGWRALALTDLHGAVTTSDAGRTWMKLDVPFVPQAVFAVRHGPETTGWVQTAGDLAPEALVLCDAIDPAATGAPQRTTPARCALVSDSFAVGALASCNDVTLTATRRSPANVEAAMLRRALEEGWPLDDGTVLMLIGRDLWRVSLADGSVVEATAQSVVDDPGRCHAVSLARPDDPAAFGFVCGTPHGPTTLFAYGDVDGRVRTIRRFATPRSAHASGNGGWLVGGSCDEREASSASTYCVGTPDPMGRRTPIGTVWREVHVEDTPGAIAAVTLDGKLARIVTEGNLEDAHLSLVGADGVATTVPLRLDDLSKGARAAVLRSVWLDGLEERRPGVLSGWLAVEGTVMGVEIDVDGAVHTGTHIQDLVLPFVAGRYGLGWTRSHIGYETSDGGTTWTPFAAPPPLAPSRVRACGPAGCVFDGWLRIGWGERPREVFPSPRAEPIFKSAAPPPLSLTCHATEPSVGAMPPSRQAPGVFLLDERALHGLTGSLKLAPPSTGSWFSTPSISRGDRLVHADLFPGFEPAWRAGPIGRVYAWGPASGDWTSLGRWVTRWRSPFGGRANVRSSAVAATPFQDAELARAELGASSPGAASFTLLVSEEGLHALRIARHNGRAPELAALDFGGTEVVVRRADGVDWTVPDAALRVGASWFIATSDGAHRTIDVFRADAGVARHLATVHRLLMSTARGQVRLARAEGAAAIGLVIEGEPPPHRAAAGRWVVPIDIESGRVDAPESLGAIDLTDRRDVSLCEDRGTSGWIFDATWQDANVTVEFPPAEPVHLHRVYARLRLSDDRVCVERLAGETSEDVMTRSRPWDTRPLPGPTVSVAVGSVAGSPEGPSVVSCTRTRK